MRLWVNGELREVEEGATLFAYLAESGVDPAKVAVERNLEIVPRSRYQNTELQAEDRLEIVQFVGGG